MPVIDVNGNVHQYRGGRKDEIFIEVTCSRLAELFNRNRRTIYRWIKENKLDPTNIIDIIDKFNNPHKLDRRRRCFK